MNLADFYSWRRPREVVIPVRYSLGFQHLSLPYMGVVHFVSFQCPGFRLSAFNLCVASGDLDDFLQSSAGLGLAVWGI